MRDRTIIRVVEIPERCWLDHYYESNELEDYELRPIEDFDFDVAWYWYAHSSYCGTGRMLFCIDGKFFLYDMSHCSCYGPLFHLQDGVSMNEFVDLETLMVQDTPDSFLDAKSLYERAEKYLRTGVVR